MVQDPEWKLKAEAHAGSLTLMLTGWGRLAGYVALQWRARWKG